MDLKKLGSTRLVTVNKETSLEDAARLMRENHVGDVVVVEMSRGRLIPLGILTDRDIVMATVALGAPTAVLSAGDVMTEELVTVTEHSGIGTVIELMKEKGVKRVPILGKNGQLVGLIALEDIMDLLAKELSDLAKIAHKQKKMETQRRRKLA